MTAFMHDWRRNAKIAAAILILAGCEQKQTQEVKQASEPQHLVFTKTGSAPSGVTLHVRGRIEGEATIRADNWPAHTVAGDVDWTVYHDYFESSLVIEYLPVKPASGHLAFELLFH